MYGNEMDRGRPQTGPQSEEVQRQRGSGEGCRMSGKEMDRGRPQTGPQNEEVQEQRGSGEGLKGSGMYGLWLNNIPGMTYTKTAMLYRACGSAREVYGMDREALMRIPGLSEEDAAGIVDSREHWNLEREWVGLQERGVRFVTVEDGDYPQKLRNIHNPPHALYYIGRLPDGDKKSVAIVGARGRSAYGSQIAGKLAEALCAAGAQVVSGMARGIDADGHAGALAAGGSTYAVLGCGVDICYPRQNQHLYMHIPEKGGILSEYPMGTAPRPMHFPQRNRIIAGLSDCTVVIEARAKSGSLITADYAMEQGREVYALPGRVTDALSQGTNSLIRQGAGVLTGVGEFLEELELFAPGQAVQMDFRKNLLEKDESLVYSLFDFVPLGLGSMIQKSPYGLTELLDILGRLERKGFVKETVPNYFVKII